MPDTSLPPSPQSSFESLAPPPEAPVVSRRSEPVSIEDPVANMAYGPGNEPPIVTVTGEIVKYAISLLILVGGAGVMWGLYLLKAPPKDQISQELIPMVRTVDAKIYAGQLKKVISGTVVPYREIRVAAEINGNVIKKYDEFEAGNFVKKDTPLLEIDPTDYQLLLDTGLAEVEQAQKMMEETQEEIAGAKRNIVIAETEYKLAHEEFDRNDVIRAALSSTEFDQAKRNLLSFESALVTRKNNLAMLEARVQRMAASLALSNAQLNRTNLNLSKTMILAPVDGVIVREMVQEGDFVRAGDQLVMFEDTSRSEVICNLTPSDLNWIRDNASLSSEYRDENTVDDSWSVYHIPKMPVSVYEIAEPNSISQEKPIIWKGVLERFDGIGRDESTRTIPCRITIDKPVVENEAGQQRALVRGMYVKCQIEVQTSANDAQRQFLSFPAVALQPGNFVWIVENHKLSKVPVEVVDYANANDLNKTKLVLVSTSDGTLQTGDAIVKTLQPGDAIVTTPLSQPSDDAVVILEGELDTLATEVKPDAE